MRERRRGEGKTDDEDDAQSVRQSSSRRSGRHAGSPSLNSLARAEKEEEEEEELSHPENAGPREREREKFEIQFIAPAFFSATFSPLLLPRGGGISS